MSQQQTQTINIKRQKKKPEKPRNFMVIIYNDDFTTMDFVVNMLMTVFFKTQDEAEALMMKVHLEGQAVAGVYSYDIATSKVAKATRMARAEGFPLRLEVKAE
ncbi:MAG: ATP-dependent Clp protease adaptor ClpS [Prevotella sp.]|jgi:ATP-dependent Clp protease adaptor protein ClpS|nr:ATP-dependent Clp protease adaptor ClpS [Prevotella sp.]